MNKSIITLFIIVLLTIISTPFVNAEDVAMVVEIKSRSQTYSIVVGLQFSFLTENPLQPAKSITCTLNNPDKIKWLDTWDYKENKAEIPHLILSSGQTKLGVGVINPATNTITFSDLSLTKDSFVGGKNNLEISANIGLFSKDVDNVSTDGSTVKCSIPDWKLTDIADAIKTSTRPHMYNPPGVIEIVDFQPTVSPHGYVSFEFFIDIWSTMSPYDSLPPTGPTITLSGPHADKFKFMLNGDDVPTMATLSPHQSGKYPLVYEPGAFSEDNTIISFPQQLPRAQIYILASQLTISFPNIVLVLKDSTQTLNEDEVPTLSIDFPRNQKFGVIGALSYVLPAPTVSTFDHLLFKTEVISDTTRISPGTLYLTSAKANKLTKLSLTVPNISRLIGHRADPSTTDEIIPTMTIGGITFNSEFDAKFTEITFTSTTGVDVSPTQPLDFNIQNLLVISASDATILNHSTTIEIDIQEFDYSLLIPITRPLAFQDYSPAQPTIIYKPVFNQQYGFTSFSIELDMTNQVEDLTIFRLELKYFNFIQHNPNYKDEQPSTPIDYATMVLDNGERFKGQVFLNYQVLFTYDLRIPRGRKWTLQFPDLIITRGALDPKYKPILSFIGVRQNPNISFANLPGEIPNPTRFTDYEEGSRILTIESKLENNGSVLPEGKINTYIVPPSTPAQPFTCTIPSTLRFVINGQTPEMFINHRTVYGQVDDDFHRIHFDDLKLPSDAGSVYSWSVPNVSIYLDDSQSQPLPDAKIQCTSKALSIEEVSIDIVSPTSRFAFETEWAIFSHPLFHFVTAELDINNNMFTEAANRLIFDLKNTDTTHDYGFYVHDPQYEAVSTPPPKSDELRTPVLIIGDKKVNCQQITPFSTQITCNDVNLLPVPKPTRMSFDNIIILRNPTNKVDNINDSNDGELSISVSIPTYSKIPSTTTITSKPVGTTDYPDNDRSNVIIQDFKTHLDKNTKQVSFSLSINSTNKIKSVSGIEFSLPADDQHYRFLVHDKQYKSSKKLTAEDNAVIPWLEVDDVSHDGIVSSDGRKITFTAAELHNGRQSMKLAFKNIYIIKSTQSVTINDDMNIDSVDDVFADEFPRIYVSIPSYGIYSAQRQLDQIPTQTTDFEEPTKSSKPSTGLIILIIIIIIVVIVLGVIVAFKFVIPWLNRRKSSNSGQVGIDFTNSHGYDMIDNL